MGPTKLNLPPVTPSAFFFAPKSCFSAYDNVPPSGGNIFTEKLHCRISRGSEIKNVTVYSSENALLEQNAMEQFQIP